MTTRHPSVKRLRPEANRKKRWGHLQEHRDQDTDNRWKPWVQQIDNWQALWAAAGNAVQMKFERECYRGRQGAVHEPLPRKWKVPHGRPCLR